MKFMIPNFCLLGEFQMQLRLFRGIDGVDYET
jgi:hypothetical protein